MECPCRPAFNYKSKSTYASHLKSDTHKLYEYENSLASAQNRIAVLEGEIGQKALVERTLLCRIMQLESESIWYRAKLTEVSPSTLPSGPETSS